MARKQDGFRSIVSDSPVETTILPAHLMSEQARATELEQEPKPVPLVRVKEPDGKGFVDQPPIPPVAAPSPAPRCVHQNERAPHGLRRFKISCSNYGEQPFRYILASDEQEAREHYLRSTGLAAVIRRMEDDGVEKIEKPRLSVTSLRD